MKYITSYGAIYRISDKNWFRFLERVSKKNDADLEDFGGTTIGIITTDISDITPEQAQDELDMLKQSMLP